MGVFQNCQGAKDTTRREKSSFFIRSPSYSQSEGKNVYKNKNPMSF